MPETGETWRREPTDELGLVDVWLVLKSHWPWTAACAVALAVAALVLSLMAPSVWEAAATILPAYAWQPGQTTAPQPLELVARSAERLRARSFGDAVLQKSGLRTLERDPEARLFRDSLKVTQPPNTDLIHIVVRAHSVRLATSLLQGMIEDLRSVQDELLKPTLTRFRAELANTRDDLTRARSEEARLQTLRDAEKGLAPANRFSQSVQLGGLIATKTTEIENLQQRQLLFEEALNPAKSHGVLVVDRVRVGERPVSPRPLRNTVLGGLVGLLLGIFVVFLMRFLRVATTPRAAEVSSPHLTARGASGAPDERGVKTERGV
jgi:uncharacterized protein involved in exopolysaccharide biosynthesis